MSLSLAAGRSGMFVLGLLSLHRVVHYYIHQDQSYNDTSGVPGKNSVNLIDVAITNDTPKIIIKRTFTFCVLGLSLSAYVRSFRSMCIICQWGVWTWVVKRLYVIKQPHGRHKQDMNSLGNLVI